MPRFGSRSTIIRNKIKMNEDSPTTTPIGIARYRYRYRYSYRVLLVMIVILGWYHIFVDNRTMQYAYINKALSMPKTATATATATAPEPTTTKMTRTTTTTTTVTTTTTDRRQCLGIDFEERLDELLSASSQVFVVMPAKSAGSTMKFFTKQCVAGAEIPDNALNINPGPIPQKSDFPLETHLTDSLRPHKLIASHLYKGIALQNLVKHATRDSLIIYMHREETARYLSAIQQRVTVRYCPKFGEDEIGSLAIDNCVIPETKLIALIKTREKEIGNGAAKILSCESYDAIDDNAPNNFVFVHYKQANRLQRLLAKKFCPEYLDESPYVRNAASDKPNISVLLDSTTTTTTAAADTSSSQQQQQQQQQRLVPLEEWLDAKRDLLEYATLAKSEMSCQAKTRAMEEALFSCPDETLQILSKGDEWLSHHLLLKKNTG